MRSGLYAFAVAAAFLGATIYIALVEQPARLTLDGRAMVQEWKLSNRRGTLVLSVLAVLSAAIAFIQFRMNGDVRWTIGGITILASWPYAYFDAGEYLALRRSTREVGFAGPQADAGLGVSRMGKRLDRICCLLRLRLAVGDAALIDGHQRRRAALWPTSADKI
jgi:hypothetical protein